MSDSRWRQDPEVFQLIEHLNQEDKKGDWFALTASEYAAVLKELDRCRQDFVYAARNYFWITNKDLQTQLLTLIPAQELILQKLLEIKAKGRAQKLLIIKARQLGCSTLIEALIAWRVIFFSNINALVVSYDRSHTADVLYPIMTNIYDRLPWWLKPECASRKNDEGIWFATRDPELRGDNPGLDSRVYVKAASTTTAVGMGIRLSAVHCSEVAAFEERTAKQIIDKDMRHALVDSVDTFAILESTAKGANKYVHLLWKNCVHLAEEADWYPLFLPWFFETRRVLAPLAGWTVETPEFRMREQVHSQWVKCDNKLCQGYHMRFIKGEDRSETTCVTCNIGTVHAYSLTDAQLCFMAHHRKNSARDDESTKLLKQELATTGLEAFQVEGYQIFGQKAQDFANSTVIPPIAYGDFDAANRFHGCDRRDKAHFAEYGWYHCFVGDCTINHEHDDNPLLIWEWPIEGATYTCGGDVAEGLGGKAAYSVGVVTINTDHGADRQVATWRSNIIDPITFGYKLNALGLFYNSALMCVECNKYDACLGALRFNLNYPNMYRWKHIDSVNINSNKLGWWTDLKSRPRLWQTYKLWLNQEMFIVRSENVCNEMVNFVKDDPEDVYGAADKREKDDELIAIMIALFCSKEGQWNPIMGMAVPQAQQTKENTAYTVHCRSCQAESYRNTVEDKNVDPASMSPEIDRDGTVKGSGGMKCHKCGSRMMEIIRNHPANNKTEEDAIVAEIQGWSIESEWDKALSIPSYDML